MDLSFVKVLVRYDPNGDAESNQRQRARLKKLSDYCLQAKRKFLFEALVPSEADQAISIAQMQKDGIEPALWKMEGVDTAEMAAQVVAQAKSGGRDHVGVVVLGRGENETKVHHWLKIAAGVPGYIGFAVGRTIFWDPIQSFRKGSLNKDQAAQKICENYTSLVNLWLKDRS